MSTNANRTLGKLRAASSPYLKPPDFDGNLPFVATISGISEATMPSGDRKLIMHFAECGEKGIILKDGHISALGEIFGDDAVLASLTGKKITLFETKVSYKGQTFKVLQFDEAVESKKSESLVDELRRKSGGSLDEDEIP
jgi:hypothetical protein